MTKHKLTPYDPAGLWAIFYIEKKFDTLWKYRESLFGHSSAEAIHDMRVASRRLRAVLKDFESYIPKKSFRFLAAHTRNLTQKLGQVRDRDILSEQFQTLIPSEGSKSNPLPRSVPQLIHHQKSVALKELEQYFDVLISIRYPQHFKELTIQIKKQTDKSPTGSIPQKSLYFHMQPILFRRLEKVYAWDKAIHEPGCWHELHQMRIAVKRLRYSMELYTPCFNQKFTDFFIHQIKTIQEYLGKIQDLDTCIHFLLDYQKNYSNRPKKTTSARRMPSVQSPAIADLIQVAEQKRINLYNEYIQFWNQLKHNQFKKHLLDLIYTTFKEAVTKTRDLNFLERIFIDEIFSVQDTKPII